MVSKSRKQRQVKVHKRLSGDTEPVPVSTGKSVHLKKTRPNMKRKMKVRMGHESADIYDGFENSKQIDWKCPHCARACRVVGFCVSCEAQKVSGRALPAAPAASAPAAATAAKKALPARLLEPTTAGVRSKKAAKAEPRR